MEGDTSKFAKTVFRSPPPPPFVLCPPFSLNHLAHAGHLRPAFRSPEVQNWGKWGEMGGNWRTVGVLWKMGGKSAREVQKTYFLCYVWVCVCVCVCVCTVDVVIHPQPRSAVVDTLKAVNGCWWLPQGGWW